MGSHSISNFDGHPQRTIFGVPGGRTAKLAVRTEQDCIEDRDYEDQLGCARGLLWAFGIQAVLVCMAIMLWKLL